MLRGLKTTMRMRASQQQGLQGQKQCLSQQKLIKEQKLSKELKSSKEQGVRVEKAK